jgi:pilus assembly protein FimV
MCLPFFTVRLLQALRLTAGLLLLGAALQSSALTIGRPSGNAWIGKPLDLLIPLQLDNSESGDGLCLEADVLQGDARFDDKRVTLSLEPGAGPDAPRVRLRTTRAVEEPVVTVKLTAGCVTKSTRQYVLLADLPEAPPVVASPSRLAPPAGATTEGAAPAPAPTFVPPVRPSRPARVPGQATSRAAPAAQGEGTSTRPPQPRRRVVPVPVSPPPAASADDVRKPKAQASKPAAAQAPAPTGEPKSRLLLG